MNYGACIQYIHSIKKEDPSLQRKKRSLHACTPSSRLDSTIYIPSIDSLIYFRTSTNKSGWCDDVPRDPRPSLYAARGRISRIRSVLTCWRGQKILRVLRLSPSVCNLYMASISIDFFGVLNHLEWSQGSWCGWKHIYPSANWSLKTSAFFIK